MEPSNLDAAPDPALVGVCSLLAEKMGLTPDEFAASTIVIRGGQASVLEVGPDDVVDGEAVLDVG